MGGETCGREEQQIPVNISFSCPGTPVGLAVPCTPSEIPVPFWASQSAEANPSCYFWTPKGQPAMIGSISSFESREIQYFQETVPLETD